MLCDKQGGAANTYRASQHIIWQLVLGYIYNHIGEFLIVGYLF